MSLPASSTSAPPLAPQSFHQAHSQLHSQQQSFKQSTVHPAILATVLAWGGKFSEHPLIVLDRTTDRAQRSRLAKSLIRKAWEVAEAEKVHTVPSANAIIVCLLLDGLHSRMWAFLLPPFLTNQWTIDDSNDPEGEFPSFYYDLSVFLSVLIGYRGFWLNCGLRHLLHLQVRRLDMPLLTPIFLLQFLLQINNRSAVSGLIEPEHRNTMVYAWWMACLADAYSALYFRRKPVL